MKMFCGKSGRVVLYVLQTLFCSIAVLVPVFQISCRVTEEGIQILSGDYTVPELVSFNVEAENRLSTIFTEAVHIIGAVVTPVAGTGSESSCMEALSPSAVAERDGSIPVTLQYKENDKQIVYELAERTVIGKKYVLFEEVADKGGNSLTLCVPFTGYNNRLPQIILSEIQDGKASTGKLCYEFIELYVLKPGNLSGLMLYSAGDGKEKSYILPAVNVNSGDYITVHLRSDGKDCIDETGTDLTLSRAVSSCDTARDLWADNKKPRLANSADVVFIEDCNSGTIIDAMLYSKSDLKDWPSDLLKTAAEKAYTTGIWLPGGSVYQALRFDKKSLPHFFSRTNIADLAAEYDAGALADGPLPVTAGDWIMTKPSGATPGKPNGV